MITVREKGQRIRIEGHANYNECGKDIVCAGVSALVGAFLLSAKHDVQFIETRDYTEITLIHTDSRVMGMYEMLIMGLQDIAKDYPKFVIIA